MKKVGHCFLCHFRVRIFRRLKEEEKPEQDADSSEERRVSRRNWRHSWSGHFQDVCRPRYFLQFSNEAWRTSENCSVQGNNWVCTKKSWFARYLPFKISKKSAKRQSHYKKIHRYTAYLKKWGERDCAWFDNYYFKYTLLWVYNCSIDNILSWKAKYDRWSILDVYFIMFCCLQKLIFIWTGYWANYNLIWIWIWNGRDV